MNKEIQYNSTQTTDYKFHNPIEAQFMAKTILVVDDKSSVRTLLREYLTEEGFRVVIASDGREALFVARHEKPDLILLDIMMPEMSGYEFTRAFRKESEAPIILVTAKLEESDKVLGLELGADDYVTKPFSPRELVARVRAILRRHRAVPTAGGVGKAPPSPEPGDYPIRVDWDGKVCSFEGQDLDLTQSEFVILSALVGRPGVVFSRDELIDLLYPHGGTVVPKAVDVHVHNLRSKLGPEGAKLIETVRSFGYRASRRTG